MAYLVGSVSLLCRMFEAKRSEVNRNRDSNRSDLINVITIGWCIVHFGALVYSSLAVHICTFYKRHK